jgi:tRNA-splicing ligase RtcB
MHTRDLIKNGVPRIPRVLDAAKAATKAAALAGVKKGKLRDALKAALAAPEEHCEDPCFWVLARAILESRDARDNFRERDAPAPYARWGDDLDAAAIEQMEQSCRLPISVRGALLPDAHVGYGLPIGGVLAARNAVIPYAVGVDIACRMKLSVLGMPVSSLTQRREKLLKALREETAFGVGASFKPRKTHAVMDEDWSVTPISQKLKDKAWAQLGTSGSGNHFVEFGALTLETPELGLEAGVYLALLSHSGSRGVGNELASHYSRLAMNAHPELPRELLRLAWFELDSAEGREYWAGMQLMGRYASANHALIHQAIVGRLDAEVLCEVENHHNFAWLETYDGQELVVHRKGATPAQAGVLGVIPGSMASPGYVVRGKGNPASLHSASHGAGRAMSRAQAKNSFTWRQVRERLAESGVELLAAGLDEAPMAYKDIHAVLAAQGDLVELIARFDPALVMMAGPDERPED